MRKKPSRSPATRSPLGSSLFRPIDAASLVFFRIGFGVIMLWEVLRYWHRIPTYASPGFHFHYSGFEWVKPWSIPGMHAHFVVMGCAAAFVALGFFYRFFATVFFVTFSHMFLLEQAKYLNHHYLVILLSILMIFLPAHRCFSFDALAGRVPWSATVPAWSVSLLRFQMGLVYFYAALAKLNVDWLRAAPMHMWIEPTKSHPLLGEIARQPWAPYFVSYSGFVFDLLVTPALLWRPTRPFAFAAAMAFHLGNSQIFSIGIFPYLGMAITTIFLDPGWPRRLWAFVRKVPFVPAAAPEDLAPPSALHRRLVVVGFALWAAFQILFPLRHLLYPGDVNWTEEGHNFSWHMKLRDKEGDVCFLVRDPKDDWERHVDPPDYLTQRQYEKMVGDPDMVLQFAHWMKRRLEKKFDRKDIEIRAHDSISLNGRRRQHLIDPDVDLGKVTDSMAPKDWLVPLAEPLFPIDGLARGDGWKAEGNIDRH